MTVRILHGDCRERLRELLDNSVHCVVTSPPYWGLRDYGVAGQIGLEPSYQEYVATMVEVFREVRRVLRADGVCWLNLGDSYAGSWGNQGRKETRGTQRPINGEMLQVVGDGRYPDAGSCTGSLDRTPGMKPKDLCGIPWRVAFALQADGWWLRQDIIWSKPNPMPESVTDRCTKAHEYLFHLAKSDRYYHDGDAIREPYSEASIGRYEYEFQGSTSPGRHKPGNTDERYKERSGHKPNPSGRNKRSVWTIPSAPFAQAHFATFPPALVEPCILAGCPKDGTVLDPFGGAGTVGLVADRLGRNAILIELSQAYIEMSRSRIASDAPLFVRVAAE